MTFRERITASLHHELPDRLPFFHYWRHSAVGETERVCRNRGLGIGWVRSPHRTILHDVEVTETHARIICASQEPLYRIAAEAPVEVVICGDNIDSVITPPDWFEGYVLPVYRKQAEALHRGGKQMAVHMDGRLAALKDLIAASPIDIIEGFHPPPLGDLSLEEALEAWSGKSIWVGFPGPVYRQGPAATRAYARKLLSSMRRGDRVVLQVSTENQVSNANLLAVTGVFAGATLPLT